MKKRVTIVVGIFLFSIILFSNLVSAYSFTGRVVDDVRMFFAGDEKKVEIALEVREKQIDSAIEEAKAGNTEEAIEILEDAKEKLEIVQEKTSSGVAGEVKTNVEEIIEKIIENEDIDPEFDEYLEEYLKEEEKTKLSAEFSEKLFDYCEELAKQDYELMLQDEKCNPDNAPDWLGDEIEDKFKETQEQAAQEMIEQLTICMTDPRECDCSNIPITSEKAECERSKALAIRCEFQDDESACRQLGEMKPEIPSNLPKFLRPFFRKTVDDLINKKEKEMMEKHAPPECVQAGAISREECEAIMMEKYAPSECIAAGATTKEECDKIMFSIHGPPPNECMENGEFIGEEACNEKMISSGMIPKECIKDGMPISEEECRKIMEEKGMMGPPECKGLSKEECDNLMREKGMGPPPECEGLSKEECDKLMKEKGMQPGMTPPLIDCKGLSQEECRILMEEQGIVMAPPECEGLSEEECNRLIMERGLIPPGMTEPKVAPGKEFKIPQECVGMTFQECEDYLMGNYMPQDCINAGALTPEACKQTMLPQECKQAGALRPEECGAIMIRKGMPQECQDAGASTPEECAKLMSKNIVVGGTLGSEVDYLNKKGISFDEIPDVCMSGSNFVRSMECDSALAVMGIILPPPKDISNIPQECIKDGVPLSPQECKTILRGKIINENIPEVCREKGITDPEECGRVLDKKRKNAGIGMQELPPECYSMSVLECKIFMDEHGMEKIDVMGLMRRRGQKQSLEKSCKEGDVKIKDCGEGVEITECICKDEMWACSDAVCPIVVVPGQCEEGKIEYHICRDGTEVPWCVCESKMWVCVNSPEIACSEASCNEGEIKNHICPDGTEVSWCECENEIWECVDSPENACPEPEQMVCCKTDSGARHIGALPTYKWVNQIKCNTENELVEIVGNEYCEEEKPECEEGYKTTRMCDSGIEITSCYCDHGKLMCMDNVVCPVFTIPPEETWPIEEEIPMECFEMGITDESACEIVISKINEERIKNGDKMIIDEDGEKDYITNEQINKIADEAEKRAEEYEFDLEQAEEIKGELEDIEREIEMMIQGPAGPTRPESESTITGESIREIEPSDNFLIRFLEKIFG